jgi:hypothetical protein
MADGTGARSVAVMNQHTLLLRTAQAGLGLMGAVVTFGSIYFSAIAPPIEVDALGWAVGGWALAMAVAMLVCAVRLPTGDRARRFAIRLLALHLLFGAVKIVGYDETEAALFMAFDTGLIVLLARLGRPAARVAPARA